jgi:hypothetical protein
MPPVELGDDQFAILNGAHKLMDELMRNPKTKHQAEALVKQIHPGVVTEADRAAPLINAVKHVNQKVDQTINYLKAREIDDKLNGAFNDLRRAGYTEEGIDKIKELMVKERIPNPAAAAAFWEKQNPPQVNEASLFSPSDWGFGQPSEDADLKLLWSNEDRWAERETARVLKEISKGELED